MLHKDLGELENLLSSLWISVKTAETRKDPTNEELIEMNQKLEKIVQLTANIKTSNSYEVFFKNLFP